MGRPYYGKRSADAEPEADAALLYGAYPAAYGYGAYGYGLPYGTYGSVAAPVASGYLNLYGKRSADAEADPGAATSFVARSPQGLGKRSADPALLYGTYGVAPYVTGNTYGYGPSGYGIAQGHPGAASSFQSVTRLH